jgi:hypothetical protein
MKEESKEEGGQQRATRQEDIQAAQSKTQAQCSKNCFLLRL